MYSWGNWVIGEPGLVQISLAPGALEEKSNSLELREKYLQPGLTICPNFTWECTLPRGKEINLLSPCAGQAVRKGVRPEGWDVEIWKAEVQSASWPRDFWNKAKHPTSLRMRAWPKLVTWYWPGGDEEVLREQGRRKTRQIKLPCFFGECKCEDVGNNVSTFHLRASGVAENRQAPPGKAWRVREAISQQLVMKCCSYHAWYMARVPSENTRFGLYLRWNSCCMAMVGRSYHSISSCFLTK